MQPIDVLKQSLIETLGNKAVRSDDDALEAHAGDWSELEHHKPALVIYPTSSEEVAVTLKLVASARCKAVIQGGLTGVAGAATPQNDEVAISLVRMNGVERYDALAGTVTVQAGITLQALQEYLEPDGWSFPLDLGSRGTCQVGGNAATNAGGNKVIRFGTMRGLVLGIEVALPNGTVLSMLNEVTKNTTGIDLKQLFIGSEGTLGVITKLTLKLSPLARSSQTALCAMDSFEQAALLLKHLKASFPGLSTFELMWDGFMQAGEAASNTRPPFDKRYPLYALLQVEGSNDALDREALELQLGALLEDGSIRDAIIASSLADVHSLWAQREAIPELLSLMKPVVTFDIGLPLSEMDNYVTVTSAKLKAAFPEQQHLFFGHLGDGNLHILSGPHIDDVQRHKVYDLVFEGVAQARGCISSEHGIGILKRPYLHLSRTEAELAVMRQLKGLFDPDGVLNMNRVF